MIGVVAVLKIKEGTEAQFEAGFKELAEKVRANEPGNIFYQLTKSRSEPLTYKVLELYADEEALKHHGQTEYFRAAGGTVFAPVLAGRPEIEYLDAVL
jgi:quinol monooxygenase YgiN